jgi:hypothetical protein
MRYLGRGKRGRGVVEAVDAKPASGKAEGRVWEEPHI